MSEHIVRMPPDMPYEIKAELNAWYVESEPIVRCRDCKYYDRYPNDYVCVCYRFDNEQPIVEPDGFCAWGERKEVNE